MNAAEHVEEQLAAGSDEVVVSAAEAYELLEQIDGMPTEERRALLALDHPSIQLLGGATTNEKFNHAKEGTVDHHRRNRRGADWRDGGLRNRAHVRADQRRQPRAGRRFRRAGRGAAHRRQRDHQEVSLMCQLRDVWDVARWAVAGAGRSDHEVTWREGLLYGYAWPTYWGWRWELREPEGALVAGMSARTWCGVKLAAKRSAAKWRR